MMRSIYIVDTNVLIAGFISRTPNSPTRQILDAMFNGRLLFLMSHDLLFEYRQVLLRPKISRAHGLDESDVDLLLTELVSNALWRETDSSDQTALVLAAPDPQDNHLWALLACEPESTLVTGDQLLIENPRPGSHILSPADCLVQLNI
jgi:uncharacterized protein